MFPHPLQPWDYVCICACHQLFIFSFLSPNIFKVVLRVSLCFLGISRHEFLGKLQLPLWSPATETLPVHPFTYCRFIDRDVNLFQWLLHPFSCYSGVLHHLTEHFVLCSWSQFGWSPLLGKVPTVLKLKTANQWISKAFEIFYNPLHLYAIQEF